MAFENSQQAKTAAEDAAASLAEAANLAEAAKASAQHASQFAAEGLEAAKATVSDFASNLAESLKSGAEAQKNIGADAIGSFARAARDAAKDMDESSPQVARLMRASADSVERLGDNIRGQSLAELAHSMDGFASQRPIAFIGCGILAGVILGRLFSSAQR